MPLPAKYCCQCCTYWTGDREAGEDAEGACIRFPNGKEARIEMESTVPGSPPTGYEGTVKVIKKASDTCGEWKNYMIPHGGIVPGPPEYP